MAAATATATAGGSTSTSSSAQAHNPWDEEIVPALRKRLEAESQRLGKRMSRMLADDAVHPLGPMVWKDPAETARSRTLGKASTGSSSARTQSSLRSASGPATAAAAGQVGRWDEAREEQMPASRTGSKDVEQAREKARRLRQANVSGALQQQQQQQQQQKEARRRSRQISEAQPTTNSSTDSRPSVDEWEGFYEPTSSKSGGGSAGGAARSRTVSTPLKPSSMAARRREERERMERENHELFGTLVNGLGSSAGSGAKENEGPSSSNTARRKRAQGPGLGETEDHLSSGTSAKVRRSTSQSILQPSLSSSVRLDGNNDDATADSAWTTGGQLRTPSKRAVVVGQAGHHLVPPVASPHVQSASAPVSPLAQRSRSSGRRQRQGTSALDPAEQERVDDFGPLGGRPRRQRSRNEREAGQGEEEGEAGDVSMQSTHTHTSAWDEELLPTVARRLQQQQLLAAATSSGGGAPGIGGGAKEERGGEGDDFLIDTWDRKGLPLSASEKAIKRRERKEREEKAREEEERETRERERQQKLQQQQQQATLGTQQQASSGAEQRSSFAASAGQGSHGAKHQQQRQEGYQWQGSQLDHNAQSNAAALLGGSQFDAEPASGRGKKDGQDVGAGCCKCSVM